MYGLILVSLASDLAQCLAQSRHSMNLFFNVLHECTFPHLDHSSTVISALATNSIYGLILNEPSPRDDLG